MCEHIFLLGDERYEVSENYIIVHLDKINRFIKRSIYSGSLRSRLECAEYPSKARIENREWVYTSFLLSSNASHWYLIFFV